MASMRDIDEAYFGTIGVVCRLWHHRHHRYQPVILANSQTNAGGVGVYVSDKLTVTLLSKNELNSNCEDI